MFRDNTAPRLGESEVRHPLARKGDDRLASVHDERRAHPAAMPTLDVVPIPSTAAYKGLRRSIAVGLTAVLLSSAMIVGLMAKTVISGAVIATGLLVAESGRQRVQHPVGGVVAQILVADGQEVKAGQPLLNLDTTVAQAQSASATSNLLQQQARLDRLMAERDGRDELTFQNVSTELFSPDGRLDWILETERRQFALRRDNREGQRSQLRERISQTLEQVRGDTAQLEAADSEIGTISAELEGLRKLFRRKLVPYQRLSELERELSQIEGRRGSLRSAIAGGNGRIAEIELQIIQVDQTLRAELTNEIGAAQEAVSTLFERRIVANDTIRRSVILAPQSGTVNDLRVHTVGGVIQPAEQLMLIVPENDRLVGEMRVSPTDVDQLYAGQEATLHFSSFDRGTTPALYGRISSVSADLLEDSRNGAGYYLVRIQTRPEELAKLGDLKLVPGMPLEAYIRTSDRTLMSYFTKPLTDQMSRALR